MKSFFNGLIGVIRDQIRQGGELLIIDEFAGVEVFYLRTNAGLN